MDFGRKKTFNTTGPCNGKKHFMVDLSKKVEQVKCLVDAGKYFVINRPRQYGKTTLLSKISRDISDNYIVIRSSFEGVGELFFSREEDFSKEVLELFADSLFYAEEKYAIRLRELSENVNSIKALSKAISIFVKECDKPVVLIIDEVDKCRHNQLFLSFIGMLRSKFIYANDDLDYTFYSVILAGVYDIKNLKLKLREGEETRYNSPWNIAVNFDVDMSFNEAEIGTMLEQYAKETGLDLDIEELSKEIYKFTSGYPFLVSRICQIVDEDLLRYRNEKWTVFHIHRAIKILLEDKNTLFDDLIKNLENNTELYEYIYNILVNALPISYNLNNPVVDLGHMFGYLVKNKESNVVVSNQILKEVIYGYMVSKTDTNVMSRYNFKDNFVASGNGLNMEKILLRFQQFMKENYSTKDTDFLERHGVLLFLSFIKPIINGVGFDYKEVQISEERRLDIVIQYNNNKYVIETKIWRGEEAHGKGIKQLKNYLEVEGLDKGYLLVFSFNKGKEYIDKRYVVDGKEIFEVRV